MLPNGTVGDLSPINYVAGNVPLFSIYHKADRETWIKIIDEQNRIN